MNFLYIAASDVDYTFNYYFQLRQEMVTLHVPYSSVMREKIIMYDLIIKFQAL